MGVAILNIGCGAAVLTGIGYLLSQRFFQGRNAGQILGEQNHIIVPCFTAVSCIGAVDGGHGQGHKEGVNRAHNHFGNLGFHNEVQTEVKIGCGGLAMGIGQGHLGAAVGSDIGFQSILHGSGILVQRSSQRTDDGVGIKEEFAGIQLGSVGKTLTAIQTQST